MTTSGSLFAFSLMGGEWQMLIKSLAVMDRSLMRTITIMLILMKLIIHDYYDDQGANILMIMLMLVAIV